MSNKVFIDLDGVYQFKKPDINIIILTNLYAADWAINVNLDREIREEALTQFESYCAQISKNHMPKEFDLKLNKMILFNSFFFPLGQWIAAIRKLINEKKINSTSEIRFSSISNNANVFLLEAEGESNGQFLYKKPYFLSYYLSNYLNFLGYNNIVKGTDKSFKSSLSFKLRGPIIIFAKALQLLFYKLFVFKRDFNAILGKVDLPLLSVSSRGIVQTHFVEGLYSNIQNRVLMIINEASSKPYRNFKAAKKLFNSFYYAEGLITFKQVYIEFFNGIKYYFVRGENIGTFMGITIDLYKLLPETGVYQFHMKTYAHSVKNTINIFKSKGFEIRKMVSFEMLSPFSFYLKQDNLQVVQVQTTAMYGQKNPNFVYSEKFYFYNIKSYKEQSEINKQMKNRLSYLNNIQYVGKSKLLPKETIRTITYFTQPIYFNEEIKLIEYLKLFCSTYNFQLQIKLHPRSPIPNIDLNGIKIINETENSQEIVLRSDLVITRNSSIGLDCWFANVPVIFFLNGTLNKCVESYMPLDYLGIIKGKPTIEEFYSNLDSIKNDFYNHSIHKGLQVDEEAIKSELFKNIEN